MPRATNRVVNNRRPELPHPATGAGATVLLLEDEASAAAGVAEQLQQHEGLRITRCWPPGATGSCVGMHVQGCPLADPVTIVLDVRSGRTDQLTRGELGVVCAEASGTPVIVAGPTRPSRASVPWASATCSVEDAAEFCHRLVTRPAALRDLRIEHTVRMVLAGEDLGLLTVTVTDWDTGLVVAVDSERLPSTASCSAVNDAVRAQCDESCAVVFSTTQA